LEVEQHMAHVSRHTVWAVDLPAIQASAH
jgi:hypothetical protein